MKEPMDQITLSNEHGRITMQLDANAVGTEVVEMFSCMLLGLTYSRGSIADAMREIADMMDE